MRQPTAAEKDDIEQRFGVPDPEKVMAQVNEICDTKLPVETQGDQ